MINPISYWRLKDRYFNLIGTKCKACGAEWFPPVRVCRKCGSQELDDFEMPHTGKLLAHTVLRETAEEFKIHAPYILGMVELDNGQKLLAQIVDVDVTTVQDGTPVRLTLRKLTEDSKKGTIFYGYKFTPLP
jgi:hypothetical protein